MANLLLGDCAEQMRTLADNSIDAIVTDPPYGLAFMGAKWDNFGGKSCGNDSIEERKRKAKEYRETHKGCGNYPNSHSSSPTRDEMANFQSAMIPIFAEALRVAKPGAHLLAFGGTRTYHRLACAIEDAGWEVRDCIMWVYGSGFPKSMDVSKAIDKTMGAERPVVGQKTGKSDIRGGKFVESVGKPYLTLDITAPATPEAAAWNGWGTCLKPAVEPIVVARKPLEDTVAANVLKYGTGAINIDGCRVPTEEWENNKGRFPTNLIHDGSDEVLALFPDCGKSGTAVIYNSGGCNFGGKLKKPPMQDMGYADSGSVARFFYCAKASRKERGEGNVHPTVKPLALMRYLVCLATRKGGIVLDPFMGSGTTGVAAVQEGMNFVGIEKDPHYYEIASRRVNDAKPIPPTTTQQELPL